MKRLGLLRGFIAAAMAIAFLSLVAGGASAADTASIKVHVIQCDHVPTTDWFSECTTNVVGSNVTVGAQTIATDANGWASFTALAAGDYAVSAPVAGATSGFAFCSSDKGRTGGWHVNGAFTVKAVAAGEQVICDSFGVVIPAPPSTGSLTIHARVCAVGQPTTDIFTDCHGNTTGAASVVKFTVDGTTTGTVDASGNISWTGVPNGTHAVTEDVSPAGTKATRVFCSSNGGTATEVANTNGDFSVTINGDDVLCDSYSLLSTGSTGGNGTGNGTGNSSGNGASSGGNAASGNGTTLPNTGTGSSAGNDNLFYGFSALFFVALVAFGGAEVVRRRQQ